MNSTTLYFPGLRPDNFFTIGNTIYSSTPFGIKRFKIIEKKDLVFYCIDEESLNRRAFTYVSHQILSREELCYIKGLIDHLVHNELKEQECTSENIYRLLSEKVKNGDRESVLLFHRLDVMFAKQYVKVKYSLNFIQQVKDFQP